MRLFALAIAIALIAASPSAAGKDKRDIDPRKVERTKVKLDTEDDRFTGLHRTASRPKPIGGTGLFTTLYVNPVYFRDERGVEGFYLRVNYSGFGWVFLDGNVTMIINGTDRIKLTPLSGAPERRVSTCSGSTGCIVDEVVRAYVEADDFRKIATASRVEFRADGKNYVEGYFKPVNVAAFRAVMNAAPASAFAAQRKPQEIAETNEPTQAEIDEIMSLKPPSATD